MALTTEQKEAYLASGGAQCPYCGSFEIAAESQVQVDGMTGWQNIVCKAESCGQSWLDLWELTGVMEDDR